MSDPEVVIVLVTAPSDVVASALAEHVVAAGLVACVNIVPGIRSVYRWQGAVESATEQLLVMKTTAGRLAALQDAIAAAHPYDVPEIIALPVLGGLPAYLQWIVDETRPGAR
jgi:periplasmic divalent cation tolerance protein